MNDKSERALQSIDNHIVVKRHILYGERLNQPYPSGSYSWSDYTNQDSNQGSISIIGFTRP